MNIKHKKYLFAFAQLIILVIALLLFFGLRVDAVIGEDNVTVQTLLQVGSVYPEVLNVSCSSGDSTFSLTPATTTKIDCVARVRDFNGEEDINQTNGDSLGIFFDTVSSSYGASDDNNDHYTNSSCQVITDFVSWQGYSDDAYTVLVNCTFDLEYYANPNLWNFTITVNDSSNLSDTNSDTITISQLLALGLPDSIDYGTVNATYVSNENVSNVTNYGNVQINLTLEGYAQTRGDNKAMNCSLGSIGYIGIDYEKYNLTNTNPGDLTLTQFEANYTNLTSTAVTKRFELNYRQNDVTNEAINSTYWRIYVPKGVAGTCTGNIIFGATLSPGT